MPAARLLVLRLEHPCDTPGLWDAAMTEHQAARRFSKSWDKRKAR